MTVALLVPTNTDRIVQIDADELALMDSRIDEVSVLSLKICDTAWLCLLHFASPGKAWNNSVAARVDCRGLDHWRGFIWDPGIMGQQCLLVCYDCLCLMALCRDTMLFVHDWAALSMWTVAETGYCRTITWELGCFGSINPPCDVDQRTRCGGDTRWG